VLTLAAVFKWYIVGCGRRKGTGAAVMKRIATAMVGGIISALFMVLIVFPAVYYWKGCKLK